MSKIIFFNKDEKLAILKIMIDINNLYNRYDSVLPKGVEYIQKTASYLGVANEISVAYILQQTTACDILEKALRNDNTKEEFVSEIFSILLLNKDTYGFKSFEKHCQDAKYLTRTFIKNAHFSHYAKDPINSSDYILIEGGTSNIQTDPILKSSKEHATNLNTINETLYKDL